MGKFLLTSAGWSDNAAIGKAFQELAGKPLRDARVLFIPTAANNVGAILVLPKCINELLQAGIAEGNIDVDDLHKGMDEATLRQYDAVYVAGGSTEHLLERIGETGFRRILTAYLANGGVYVGVSAGSIAATKTLPNALGYLNCTMDVHQAGGSPAGIIDTANCPHINLTDRQAVLVADDNSRVIE